MNSSFQDQSPSEGGVRDGRNAVVPPMIDRPGAPYIDYLPDNFAEVMADYPVLARPCAACPATPGTEASLNHVTARILADSINSRCGFFCHLTVDGEVIGASTAPHLCAGWFEAVECQSRTPPERATGPGMQTETGASQ